MLDRQHTHGPFAPDNRHASKGVELFFARFGAEREVGMGGGFGQVQRFDVRRNRTNQTFANGKPRYVHGSLIKAARGEEFQHPFAQEIDRADFAIETAPDGFNHLIQLCLRPGARRHHFVKRG